MIIAVDFDGTLCEHKYPQIGKPHTKVVNKIKELKDKGHTIILLTCRNGIELERALEWSNEQGLIFDAVNDDVPEVKKTFIRKSNKVYADVYVDDRNITINQFVRGILDAIISDG